MKRKYTRRKPLGAHWPRFNLSIPVGYSGRFRLVLEHNGYNDERSGLAVHIEDKESLFASDRWHWKYLMPHNSCDRKNLARIVLFFEKFAAAYRWEEKHPPEGRRTK